MTNIQDFWESCPDKFAHLDETREKIHQQQGDLLQSLDPAFKLIDFENKVVLDYGIGKGDFGKYLYDNKDILKYIAMDVAQRSLLATELTLTNYPPSEYLEAHHNFLSLQQKFKIDIFTTFACIQHFPDIVYVESFFNGLNQSNIEHLILQTRHSRDTIYAFTDGAYTNTHQVAHRFRVKSSFVQTCLDNYLLIYESEISPKSKYQYLIFERIK